MSRYIPVSTAMDSEDHYHSPYDTHDLDSDAHYEAPSCLKRNPSGSLFIPSGEAPQGGSAMWDIDVWLSQVPQVTPPAPERRLCHWSPGWDTRLATLPTTRPQGGRGPTVPSTAPAPPAAPGRTRPGRPPTARSTTWGLSGPGWATLSSVELGLSLQPGRPATWTPPGEL